MRSSVAPEEGAPSREIITQSQRVASHSVSRSHVHLQLLLYQVVASILHITNLS